MLAADVYATQTAEPFEKMQSMVSDTANRVCRHGQDAGQHLRR